MYVSSGKKVGCISLAVVNMTTTKTMQPPLSGSHTQLLVVSDLDRVLTKIAEEHTDIARSNLKLINPLLP